MQKYIKQALVLCMAIFIMSGCGKQDNEMEASSFYNSNGYFQFADMEWGSTEEDIEKVLGFNFGDPISNSDEYTVYLESDAFSLSGLSAELLCEFKAGQLSSVSLWFKPEGTEIERFWSEVSEELMAEYGEVELIQNSTNSEELHISTESETYLWERAGSPHTTLQLSKRIGNGELKRIELSVSNIDLGKAAAQ